MVQLKENMALASSYLVDISIPYGSIKRSRVRSGVAALGISIPYGSIKSGTRSVLMFTVQPFQFLMVQLKAFNVAVITTFSHKFQFLMVQLKAFSLRCSDNLS